MSRRFASIVVSLVVLPFLAFQCKRGTPRELAYVEGRAGTEKASSSTIESLFGVIHDRLMQYGFQAGNQKQPSARYLTGEPIYGEGYWMAPRFACTVTIDRRTLEIRFYELEERPKSGIYLSSGTERENLRKFSLEIGEIAQSKLPRSFLVHARFPEKEAPDNEEKAAEPGATDNPDGAQRLREDR